MKKKMVSKLSRNNRLIELPDSKYSPLVTTIEFYLVLKKLKQFDSMDHLNLSTGIKACQFVDRYGREVPGLYNECPNVGSIRVKPESIIAAGCSLAIDKTRYAKYSKNISFYGWMHGWSFDNMKPRRWTLESRLKLWEIFVLQSISGVHSTFIGFLSFYVKIIKESYYKKQEAHIHLQNWMIFEVLKEKWYIKPLYNFWKVKLDIKFQKNLGNMFKYKYGSGGAFHKLTNGMEI